MTSRNFGKHETKQLLELNNGMQNKAIQRNAMVDVRCTPSIKDKTLRFKFSMDISFSKKLENGMLVENPKRRK